MGIVRGSRRIVLFQNDFAAIFLMSKKEHAMAKMLFFFIQFIFLFSIGYSDTKSPSLRLKDIQAGSMVFKDESNETYNTIPTIATDVNIHIVGMAVNATIDQIFTNTQQNPIEAIYVFPLPEEAAVYSMQMLIGDRLIESKIKEKAEAKKEYEKAKKEGKRASLTEQERPNIFTHSVANILPGDTIIVRLKYVDIIHYRDGSFSFRFPTVVGPRYIPGDTIQGYTGSGWAFDTNQVPDASRITPPILRNNELEHGTVSLALNIDMGLAIDGVESFTHSILVKDEGFGKRKVSLNAQKEIPNRDFLLTISLKQGNEPKAAFFSTQKDNDHYFMLMAVPPTQSDETALPKEIIFIVDVSGSMRGESIRQAKQGLITAIQSLKDSDSFNIISFCDSYNSFSPNPIQVTEQSKAIAIQYINNLDADGGTEVLSALEEGLHQSNQSSLVPMIFLLTDGSVGNESKVIQSIHSHLGKTRISPIGIGSAPNSFLLQKMAELGRGTFTYISSPKEVASKIRSLYQKIENPVIANIQLSMNDSYELVPKQIPDLFQGEPLIVFGKMPSTKTNHISFSGKTPSGIMQLNFPIDFNTGQIETAISTLWGRKKISSLMNEYRLGNLSAKQSIIDVAMDHNLITKFTSFVAIENQIVNPSHPLAKVAIPVPLPKGWDYNAIFNHPNQYKLHMASHQIDAPKNHRMHLPQTATSYPLQFMVGLILLLLGITARKLSYV